MIVAPKILKNKIDKIIIIVKKAKTIEQITNTYCNANRTYSKSL